jgi:hypothetical protein
MNPPPPPVQNTVSNYTDKNAQAQIFKTEANKTRNFIFAIAAVYFIGNLITVAIAGVFTGIFIVAVILFPAIFTGVAFIAPKQPFTAIIIAAIVLVIILVILVASGASSLIGWLYFLIAAGCIAGGFISANKAEAARKVMR